jgi:peptide/nickel transport system ATP-binding protein
MRIGEQIAEGIRLHQGASKKDARLQAIDVLHQVGIPDPQARVDTNDTRSTKVTSRPW